VNDEIESRSEIAMVASLLKNSFWRMGELQPVHSPNPYNSSSMPVRFWEVPKKTRGRF
jgi:hypothetical protein